MEPGKEFSATIAADATPGPIIMQALRTGQEFVTHAQIPERLSARLLVLIEELVGNILRHGTKGIAISLRFVIRLREDGAVEIDMEDDGCAFDATAERAFDGPDAETGGGVGLALVRSWASDMTYRRDEGRNRLRLLLN